MKSRGCQPRIPEDGNHFLPRLPSTAEGLERNAIKSRRLDGPSVAARPTGMMELPLGRIWSISARAIVVVLAHRFRHLNPLGVLGSNQARDDPAVLRGDCVSHVIRRDLGARRRRCYGKRGHGPCGRLRSDPGPISHRDRQSRDTASTVPARQKERFPTPGVTAREAWRFLAGRLGRLGRGERCPGKKQSVPLQFLARTRRV